MELQVNHEKKDDCKLKLDITIASEDLKNEYEQVKQEVISEVALPGFRKGKAPVSLINKRFGKYIKEKVVQDILPKAYQEAVENHDLKVFGQPQADEIGEYKDGEPLNVSFTVDRMAECQIEDLSGLELHEQDVTINDDDVDNEVKKTIRSKAKTEESDALKTAPGQYITFDAVFTDEKYKKYSVNDYPLELSSNPIAPLDLKNDLTGLEINKPATIKKKFPKDYKSEELQGIETDIEITVKSIKEIKYPELTDALAKELKYESVDDMHSRTKKSLENFAETWKASKVKEAILSQLKEKATFEIPESLINYSAYQQVQQIKQQFGGDDNFFNNFLKNQNMTIESLMEQYKPGVKENIKNDLLLEKIVEIKEIEASEEDINAEVEKIASQQNQDPETLKKQFKQGGYWSQLKTQANHNKAIETLKGEAKIKKEKPVSISKINTN